MADIPKNQVRSRNTIEQHEHEDAASARRVVSVDPVGNPITVQNPLPVRLSDGSVNIGTVNAEVEVQLSHKNNFPDTGDVADSVRIGNGTNEVDVNSNKQLEVQDIRNLIQNIANTSKFLALGNPDKIVPNFTGNSVTMGYYEDEALIGEAVFAYTDALNWNLELFAYLNDDYSGERLQHDDGSLLLLE